MEVFVDVDVQFDFCDPAGALYVPDSPNEAFRKLTRMAVDRRIPIVGSVDSHAYDAWEFASNDNVGPRGEKPNFPDHCIKGTPGWLKLAGTLPPRFRFVPNVLEAKIEPFVDELASRRCHALYFEKEVYSMFANPLAERVLAALVRRLEADPRFVVYGVATDYCVAAAVLGLRERGYRTALVTDAITGIDEAGSARSLEQMRGAGADLIRLSDLL